MTATKIAVKRLPKDKFDDIYSQVTRLCVEVIIKTPEGVILTLRNIVPYNGFWHLPGGTVMFGERLEDAVCRVAAFEVGLDVEIDSFMGFIYSPPKKKVIG